MEPDLKIHLRIVRPSDAGDVHALFCVPEVYRYLADGESPPASVATGWISDGVDDAKCHGGGLWGLTDETDRRIQGIVRLSRGAERELELTYLLHPGLWGMGLATRMAHTVMGQAFATGRVAGIWAGADVPNVASIAVMRRLGMRFRRAVSYPAGAGVEYVMEHQAYDPGRIELIPITA